MIQFVFEKKTTTCLSNSHCSHPLVRSKASLFNWLEAYDSFLLLLNHLDTSGLVIWRSPLRVEGPFWVESSVPSPSNTCKMTPENSIDTRKLYWHLKTPLALENSFVRYLRLTGQLCSFFLTHHGGYVLHVFAYSLSFVYNRVTFFEQMV